MLAKKYYTITMTNDFKLKLFKFKNELTIEQLEVSRVVQTILENYDMISEKEMLDALKYSMQPHTYYKEVKALLESIESEMDSKPLVYNLKDLYKKVERKNLGMLYRQPLVTLLEIINRPDDDSRMDGVLNELRVYDWVPEIKHFLMQVMSSPVERQNMQNTGKANKVFTIVEKADQGHIAYIADRWFHISDSDIRQVLVEEAIKEESKIREIRMLEQVLGMSTIDNDVIYFKIDENLTIGLSLENKDVYLNGEKLDKETTIDTIFASPIIPMLKRGMYPVIECAIKNLDKFMELDIVMKTTNALKPLVESYVFNYKDKMYLYSRDGRQTPSVLSRFYAYESAVELIHDIQKEFDYDMTYFFENKISKELKTLRTLEDREKAINMKINDINESIELIKDHTELFEGNQEIKLVFESLLLQKRNLVLELNQIKESKSDIRRTIVK